MIDVDENGENETHREDEVEQSGNGASTPNEGTDNILLEASQDIGNPTQNVESLDEEAQLIVAQLQQIMIEGRDTSGISFKNVDIKCLNSHTARVNRVIEIIETTYITQTNNLIKAASVLVADQLGLKGGKKKEPWWKRCIECDIKQLKKDVSFLERLRTGEVHERREGKVKLLKQKYRVKRKRLTIVIEEIKQINLAKAAKITRYEQRIEQYRINRWFNMDQKRVYNEDK